MTGVTLVQFGVAVFVACGLIVAIEIGVHLGRRAVRNREAPSAAQIGTIQGAMLGLLALLLGFSFAAAAGRFMERQDLIAREANAIGTAYLRADLLQEPFRTDLQRSLAAYVAHRVAASAGLSETLRGGLDAQLVDEVSRSHREMWAAARDGVLTTPAFAMAVLPPVNDVIDLHGLRVAAGRKHLPSLVLGLLVVSSLLATAVIGYGCGQAGRWSRPITWTLAILIGAALWATIDLDHPRGGLIRLDDSPLRELGLSAPN